MKISEELVKYMLGQIDGWSINDGTLTVPKLLQRVKVRFGNAPTDRAIRNHLRITERIVNRKKELKSGIPLDNQLPKKPSSLAHASLRLAKLEAEVEKLKKENTALIHKFVVWQKNASDYGITEAQLNKPLYVNESTIRSKDR